MIRKPLKAPPWLRRVLATCPTSPPVLTRRCLALRILAHQGNAVMVSAFSRLGYKALSIVLRLERRVSSEQHRLCPRFHQNKLAGATVATSSETTSTKRPDSEPAGQSASSSSATLPYRYAVATILERTPIIMPEPTPEEREFQQFRLLMANARARELPPELEKQLFGKSADGNADGVQLLDPELFEVDEDGEYEPAPRETDADRTNDRRSLNRKLDRWLFLVVRRKLGPTRRALWQFPQRNIEDVQRTPEGMHEPSAASTSSPVFFRAEAEKALHSFIETSDDDADENIVGSKEEEEGEEEPFEAHFIGNAPCAHLKHTYSAAFQNAQGIAGIKIFFYRAQLISGRVTRARSPAADDFAWVTADELPEYLPPEYYRAIAPVVW